MSKVALVAHNIRSAHNVGSLLRTADGLGIDQVYLSGFSPYPHMANDQRLPHVSRHVDHQIHKAALGAEYNVKWQQAEHIKELLNSLKSKGYSIAALEQTGSAVKLNEFKPPAKLALIVGNEVSGLEESVLELADIHLKIPMRGQKESFNVSVAAAMALFWITNAQRVAKKAA